MAIKNKKQLKTTLSLEKALQNIARREGRVLLDGGVAVIGVIVITEAQFWDQQF
jgi:hypothetical protein